MKHVSVENLNDCTPQEVYDFIVNHLRTQNARAYNKITNSCRYRTAEGLTCAAGCLIPERLYDPEYEDMAWDGPNIKVVFPSIHTQLIKSLQIVHDNYLEHTWETYLEKAAHKYQLQYTPKP